MYLGTSARSLAYLGGTFIERNGQISQQESLGVTSQQTTTHTASLITTDLIGIIQKTRSVIKAHTSKPDTLTLITDTRVERRLLRLVMGGASHAPRTCL